MLNPNTKPVLNFDEKRELEGAAAVVARYDEAEDFFVIAPDERYYQEGRDTAYYDFDPFVVPALAIRCFVNESLDSADDYVGKFVVLPL